MSRGGRGLAGAVVAVWLLLVGGGAWLYRSQERHVRDSAEQALATIAQLKVSQIANWRAERLSDGLLLTKDLALGEALARWRQAPSEATEAPLRSVLDALRDSNHYRSALVVDPAGHLLLRFGEGGADHPAAREMLATALAVHSPLLTDLHTEQGETRAHLAVIAPLSAAAGPTAPTVGAVILVCDAQQFLYPLIRSWPVHSRTAETLLVRRDGDSALFLNDLRHRSDAALRLRIPLSRQDVPAVRAVQGDTGVLYGRDYRGVPVVAVLSAVPESPWSLVAKIDAAEVFARWRFEALLILTLLLALITLTGAGATVGWQRHRKAQYRALYEAEAQRRAGELQYSTTLDGIGDAVIATDGEGRVQILNPVAATLTGWTADEARGRPLAEVFRIVNEHTRQAAEDPVAKVLRDGAVVCLANHTVLLARDGTERPIADSGAPIRDETGAITGVVLVFRDQTAERAAEAALLAERDNLQAIMAAAPLGLLVVDEEERLVGANSAAERLFATTFDSPGQARYGEWLGCAQRQADPAGCGHTGHCPACPLHLAIHDVLAGGPGVHESDAAMVFEVDGEPQDRWLRLSTEPVTLNARRHVLVAMQDVSDQKDAEQALRASEQRFAQIAAHSGELIWEVDADGLYTYYSQACEPLLGYQPDEIVGHLHFYDLHPAEGREEFRRAAFAVFARQEPFHDLLNPVVRRDGQVLEVMTNGQPIVAADGRLLGYRGSDRDVTERNRLERQYEMLFREMLDGFALHEIVCDEQGQPVDYRFLEVNPAFERQTGLRAADLVGRTVLEVMPQTESHWIEEYGRVALTGEAAEFENYSQELDRHFAVTAFRPAMGQFACIFTDVTGHRRAQAEQDRLRSQLAQAQKMESIGRLAGGVAHDFNNMLQAILGHTDLALREVPPGGDVHDSLIEIEEAAQRSVELARQLLAFARRQTIAPKVLDLNQTVDGMLRMLRRMIGEDIEICWQPGAGVWPVRIDPAQVDQVLANLAINARDAIGGVGRVSIETRNATFDEEFCLHHPGYLTGDWVRLAVTDDGHGIDPAVREHLFEPFYTTKGVGQGTGLGLATVYGIVQQNDGFVTVYSEPGSGAVFGIYLPRFTGDVTVSPVVAPLRPAPGRGETILVVDDEPAILNIGRRLLEGLGYRVLVAGSPRAALEWIESDEPLDLLLTDVVMPDMTGKDLADRTTARRPHVRCVFMSGYTAEVIAHRGILEEGMHFVQKPFAADDLAAKVREALDGE